MVIRIIREPPGNQTTFGVMFIDGFFECFTLENSQKIIPAGMYQTTLYDSPKQNYMVPLLHYVPDRSYIEIHIANYAYELEGCIAVGDKIAGSMLLNSKVAFNKMLPKLTGEIVTRIEDWYDYSANDPK